MRYLSVVLIGLLTLLSCSKDDPSELTIEPERVQSSKSFPRVDQQLWSHFEQFEIEAAKRGLSYDINALQVSGNFQDLDANVAGQCFYSSAQPEEIMIDQGFWNTASETFREFIVFHELGHCVLFRDHEESADSQGRCRSIMRSGLGDCFDAYSQANRATYLDELFNTDF